MQRAPECVVRQLCRLGLLGFGLMFIAALARAEPPGAADPPAGSPFAPGAQSVPPAQSVQPNGRSRGSSPPATVVSPGAVQAPTMVEPPCDYWIVSSRNCPGKPVAGDTRCVEYYHRSSDRDLQNAGHDAFLTSLKPDVPVCFVVHGSYNWWKDVVNESRKINRWVRSADPTAPLQVVFFTWPSDGNMPYLFPVDIAVLGRKAGAHSYYLARLISELPADQPVSIVGHSHGARAAVGALHLLGGGTGEDGQALPPGTVGPTHMRAVLIAAAIDHNWLNPGQRYGQALVPPERVLLLRNSRDATLAIYPLRKGWGERALGREGFGLNDRMTMNGLQKKVVDLDAAQFAGPYHSFADYHEHPELASASTSYIFLREEGQPPSKPATTPYDSPEDKPTPILPKSAPMTAQPAAPEKAPPADGPQFVPAGKPLLLPPTLDDAAPPEKETTTPRLLRIMPRSRTASQQKVRDQTGSGGEETKQVPGRSSQKGFQMWLDD